MARTPSGKATTFQISFEGFKLSASQEASVSAALRNAALAEIAKLDFRDPIEIHPLAPPGGPGGPGTPPGMVARLKRRD